MAVPLPPRLAHARRSVRPVGPAIVPPPPRPPAAATLGRGGAEGSPIFLTNTFLGSPPTAVSFLSHPPPLVPWFRNFSRKDLGVYCDKLGKLVIRTERLHELYFDEVR